MLLDEWIKRRESETGSKDRPTLVDGLQERGATEKSRWQAFLLLLFVLFFWGGCFFVVVVFFGFTERVNSLHGSYSLRHEEREKLLLTLAMVPLAEVSVFY